MATDADESLDRDGLLASHHFRKGAPVSIRTLFMVALVKDREVLFATNRTDSHYRVFLLYVCESEVVVGASQFVGDWIVHLCAADDLGVLSGVSISRRTSN